MWPEWMIDDSFCDSPLTITQMREPRFPVHPTEAGDSDVQTPAAERDSRSIWSKRLHFVPSPHDQYSENKVFSHSESSLNDIVELKPREWSSKCWVSGVVILLRSTRSFYELQSEGL